MFTEAELKEKILEINNKYAIKVCRLTFYKKVDDKIYFSLACEGDINHYALALTESNRRGKPGIYYSVIPILGTLNTISPVSYKSPQIHRINKDALPTEKELKDFLQTINGIIIGPASSKIYKKGYHNFKEYISIRFDCLTDRYDMSNSYKNSLKIRISITNNITLYYCGSKINILPETMDALMNNKYENFNWLLVDFISSLKRDNKSSKINIERLEKDIERQKQIIEENNKIIDSFPPEIQLLYEVQ